MPQQPPAVILPFPLTRRVVFVKRLAEQVLKRQLEDGKKHLAAQLRRQAKSLRHKGFDDDVVERQITSLDRAVRAQMWRFMLGADVPAPSPEKDTA